MAARHFTARLFTYLSHLAQGRMYVAVREDELIGADFSDGPFWSPDTTEPELFHAVIMVKRSRWPKDVDHRDAIARAESLLDSGGWRTVGDWETDPVFGSRVTVERVEDDVDAGR